MAVFLKMGSYLKNNEKKCVFRKFFFNQTAKLVLAPKRLQLSCGKLV